MSKTYFCGICKTKPDQISHHKLHLDSQKHKDKKELFELKLSKLSNEELIQKYNTNNITDIITETETILYAKLNNKLNKNSTLENKVNINMELSTVENKYFSITNKEALKDKIHDIHNFIRNSGAGYGMNALKLFNILYGLKKIEENNLIDKVNLKRPECEFSHLLKLAKNNENETLADTIFKEVLKSIHSSELKPYLFYQISRDMRGEVFAHLIKEIDTITEIEKSCNVLLSGKIYEYFIGRDATAISELGAYFTDRHIVDFILKKLNPTINEDGTIPTMIDMFGGSGGFTTGYINYLNEHYNIDWNKELSKIYHYDINEDVIRSAGLEFFCLTGNFPDKNNVGYLNAFKSEFSNKKYKYPITNPPYGGDKSCTTDAQLKRNKIKEYIKKELKDNQDEGLRIRRQKQLKDIESQERQEKIDQEKAKVTLATCSNRLNKFALEHKRFSSDRKKLKGNDKESCSLMLLMDIVDVGGTAIGVLKEGVFFNKAYKDLRNCLVQQYNVREIISVPQDQFENTSTKTSILIFDNTDEATSTIRFNDLNVIRYEEDKFEEIDGNLYVVENKGDIKEVIDTLITTATLDDILENDNYSLNSKDYMNKKVKVGKDFKLVKLGDICKCLPKSKRQASFGKLDGKFNFYTSSDKVQKCDIADYNEESLIIGSGGVANIKLDNIFSCSADNIIITSNYLYYLYHLFKSSITLLTDGFTGSTIKHLSKDYLMNLQIPIPKTEELTQYWVDKISTSFNEKNMKQERIKELELFIQQRIKDIGENEVCDELELGSICEYIKTGKNKTPDNKSGTLYPYYGTADITGYTDYYLFDGYHVLVARNGTMGNCFIVNNKIYPSDHIFVLKNKVDYNIYLLYYIIKTLNKNIQDKSNGSTIKGISKENLSNILIKLPKNKELIDNLNPLFTEIEELQNDVKILEELYKSYLQELSIKAFTK